MYTQACHSGGMLRSVFQNQRLLVLILHLDGIQQVYKSDTSLYPLHIILMKIVVVASYSFMVFWMLLLLGNLGSRKIC